MVFYSPSHKPNLIELYVLNYLTVLDSLVARINYFPFLFHWNEFNYEITMFLPFVSRRRVFFFAVVIITDMSLRGVC